MLIKFLQLNIELGKCLDEIIEFVKRENFDILNFQEVTGGSLNRHNIDCFNYLKNNLGYGGELSVSWRVKGDKNSYFGNATFFKKSFSVKDKKIIWLKDYQEVTLHTPFPYRPYSVLSLGLDILGKTVQVINTHLLWGPTPQDSKEKLKQGQKLYKYLKTVDNPFILSGDFNVDQSSQIVSWISTLGRNLTVENNVTNTLNFRTHRVKHLFPRGLAVDYIFVDRRLQVKNFKVVEDEDLSDHFALAAEIEL